jgi:hypothetical protein
MIYVILGVVLVLWVLANLKSSRKDGTLLPVHPYRRIMQYIMPTRNEAVVYFDTYVDAEQLLEYIEAARDQFHVDIAHCLVGAAIKGLQENPPMNRFVVGRRVYQRKGQQVSFSMKRKKLDREAKLATVKITAQDGESFRDLCARIADKVGEERSEKRTYSDKEFDLFLAIPRPVLRLAVKFMFWLDYHNLLPHAFIKDDPLYTSMFIANLGSLKMGAAIHHLYEWGNCPLFLMAGMIEERPVVRDGELAVRKILHLRWSYDERIDDGLNARFGIDSVKRVLENPFEELGGVERPAASAA